MRLWKAFVIVFVVSSAADSSASPYTCSNNATTATGLRIPLSQTPEGGVLCIENGLYTNTNEDCGLVLNRAVVVVGGGSATTIIDCGGKNRVFDVSADGVVISSLSLRHGSSVSSGGLINVAASSFTLQNAILSNGRASHGGAVSILGNGAGNVIFVQVVFTDNVADGPGVVRGGAVFASLVGASPGARVVTLTACTFTNNTATTATGDSVVGGAVLVQVTGGTDTATLTVYNSSFTSNSAVSTTSVGSLVACGAVCLFNMNFSNATQGAMAPNASLVLTNSQFTNNTAVCAHCSGGVNSATASNTGAAGGLSVPNVTVAGCSFVGNGCSCNGDCLAEGGALFSQGASPRPGVAYALRVHNTTFTSNAAACTGTGCTVQGGGVLAVAVQRVELGESVFASNGAVCVGGQLSEGGGVQIQDGFPGATGSVSVSLSSVKFYNNTATVSPPTVGMTPSPTIQGAQGGAVQLFAVSLPITVAASNVTFVSNEAVCAAASTCPSAGGALFALTISPGVITATFNASLFTSNNATCPDTPSSSCPSLTAAAKLQCVPSCAPQTSFAFDHHTTFLDNGNPAAASSASDHLQTVGTSPPPGPAGATQHVYNSARVVYTCGFLEAIASSPAAAAAVNCSCGGGGACGPAGGSPSLVGGGGGVCAAAVSAAAAVVVVVAVLFA